MRKRVLNSVLAISIIFVLSGCKKETPTGENGQNGDNTYIVDLDRNYTHLADTPNLTKWIAFDLDKGTHTIKLKSSTSTNDGWGNLAILHLTKAEGLESVPKSSWDYLWICLNGVDDEITFTLDTTVTVRAGVIDDHPADNEGDITLEVDGETTYTVDLDQNYTHLAEPPKLTKWLAFDLDAGTHTIKLKKSTSVYYGWGTVVIFNLSAGISDTGSNYLWFVLNGVGDSKTITFDTTGTILVGVIDDYPVSNFGDIILEVE